MSLIPLAAELIRRAVTDETYAIDLERAMDDRRARQGLVKQFVRPDELGNLRPSEWIWWLEWRQQHRGKLDPAVLAWLAAVGGSRASRFAVRGIVMRDQTTLRDLELKNFESVGLVWLRHQIDTSNPVELARDALQHGTRSAWWVMERLVEDDRHRNLVFEFLDAFASARHRGFGEPLE